jgi:hypothetical protein
VQHADLIEEGGAYVAALQDITAEVGALLSARHVAACAEVDCRTGSGGPRPPAPPTVNVDSLVRAIVYGADLLAVDRQLGLRRTPALNIVGGIPVRPSLAGGCRSPCSPMRRAGRGCGGFVGSGVGDWVADREIAASLLGEQTCETVVLAGVQAGFEVLPVRHER